LDQHPIELVASWYGWELAGKPMANGQPFDPTALTCASWSYPLGTRLRVTHGTNTVTVVVTDRGPAKRLLATRQIDLSLAAFKKLADPRDGLTRVTVTINTNTNTNATLEVIQESVDEQSRRSKPKSLSWNSQGGKRVGTTKPQSLRIQR